MLYVFLKSFEGKRNTNYVFFSDLFWVFTKKIVFNVNKIHGMTFYEIHKKKRLLTFYFRFITPGLSKYIANEINRRELFLECTFLFTEIRLVLIIYPSFVFFVCLWCYFRRSIKISMVFCLCLCVLSWFAHSNCDGLNR